KRKVIACVAPSFPAAFDAVPAGKVISAIRSLGFFQVWDVAFGAELVSRAYFDIFEKSIHTERCFITTPCPAIVSYILKYMPSLNLLLVPIVSPMIAVARVIREEVYENAAVVFIGPCLAKKQEISDPSVGGAVDFVLTFDELSGMLDEAGIDIGKMGESDFDGAQSHLGRSYPLAGGLLRTTGMNVDILDNDVVTASGKERALSALRELCEGHSHARVFDLLFCDGCISGPFMLNNLSILRRKELMTEYIKEKNRYVIPREFREWLGRYSSVSMTRRFLASPVRLRQPTEQEIQRTLKSINKLGPEDRLNCGACGYSTCREKAIAVCQGLAEAEMCLPYLLDEVEEAFRQLKESHQKLQTAQQLLVQSEKLASMGQLSAGIAHEINNPLGTILLYSHILMQSLQEGAEARKDVETITREAERCRGIVRGLLNFARKSQVTRKNVSMDGLVHDVIQLTDPKAKLMNVSLKCDIAQSLPPVMLDEAQIKQVLVNLIDNGIDAIDGPGEVVIRASLLHTTDSVVIEVTDNGCGIPDKNLGKLFTPFFTTKEVGKGTGLGLAIAYGIVKMHSGDIKVRSEPGKGTAFSIVLPMTQPVESCSNGDEFPVCSVDTGENTEPIDIKSE
ncbi:MAG: [Fe-Fe] hydrogenase large subunit C-terminal domain-containing protein, partial [Pseudomonadota bacterium]